MNTILIHATDKQMAILEAFLSANDFQSRVLSEEDQEDYVLSKLMATTDLNDTVDTDSFLTKLGAY